MKKASDSFLYPTPDLPTSFQGKVYFFHWKSVFSKISVYFHEMNNSFLKNEQTTFNFVILEISFLFKTILKYLKAFNAGLWHGCKWKITKSLQTIYKILKSLHKIFATKPFLKLIMQSCQPISMVNSNDHEEK